MTNEDKYYTIIGLLITCIFIYIIIKELTKPKTMIEEIQRDTEGRITSIIRRET